MPLQINYADDIRKMHGNDERGIQMFREIASNQRGVLAATAELGKIGIDFKALSNDGSRKSAIEERADLRRAVNALTEHARKDPANLTDQTVEAMECLSARISCITKQLDLNDSVDRAMAGQGSALSASSGELRDERGERIGTLLNRDDLRSPASIASKLRATAATEEQVGMGMGDFLRGVANMRTTQGVRNALSEGTNTAGGYAVPNVLLPDILAALVPSSSLLSAGANIANLTDQASSFRIAAIDTIPTAAWRNESANIAESDPTFRTVTITPRSLSFRFKVSRELLADAPGLEQALNYAIAQAFAKEIDRAGLMGSGTAPEIRGLRNMVGVNAISMGTNGGAITDWSKLLRARRTVIEAFAPPPNALILSPREDETIGLLKDTTNQPLRRPENLADWQFYVNGQIPTNETQGTATNAAAMYAGHFSLFTVYLREQLSIQLVTELYAATGEVGFIAHARVDVAAAYPKAFAVISGVTAT